MPLRPTSLQEYLAEQLAEIALPSERRRLARHICCFIDRTGYLGVRERAGGNGGKPPFRHAKLAEIAANYDRATTTEEVEDTLISVVQKLDPPGIGARSVEECLLLQLRQDTPYREVLGVLIRDHLENIAHNRIPDIQKATKLDLHRTQAAIISLGQNLATAPGLKYADPENECIRPDLIVGLTHEESYRETLTLLIADLSQLYFDATPIEPRMVLAPRMILSMEILKLPIADLMAKIAKELQENPFLEQKEKHGVQDAEPAEFNPDSTPLKHDETGDLEFNRLDELNRDWENHFDEEYVKLDPMANMPTRPQSLQDCLAEQLGEMVLDDEQRRLARHLCRFVDRTGYLGIRERASVDDDKDTFHYATLADIAEAYDRLVTTEEVENTLVHVVQKLDPPGVGARSAKECLLLQIDEDTRHRDVLRVLVRDHLEDIAFNRIPVIQNATRFDISTIQEAIESLHCNLTAAPGLKFADAASQYVMPDVIVERDDDGIYSVRLTDEWVPTICINQRTVDLIKNKDLDDKVKDELRKKLQSADWLVKAVEQRRNTLLKVTRAIMDHQKEFLNAGPEHIHPLIMQQIADETKIHVTTVGRAVGNMWVQTPWGVFPLERFFSDGKKNGAGRSTN